MIMFLNMEMKITKVERTVIYSVLGTVVVLAGYGAFKLISLLF